MVLPLSAGFLEDQGKPHHCFASFTLIPLLEVLAGEAFEVGWELCIHKHSLYCSYLHIQDYNLQTWHLVRGGLMALASENVWLALDLIKGWLAPS